MQFIVRRCVYFFLCYRFIFILLGPEKGGMDYHEVGRSLSTLMSNQVSWLRVSYQLTGCIMSDQISWLGVSCLTRSVDWMYHVWQVSWLRVCIMSDQVSEDNRELLFHLFRMCCWDVYDLLLLAQVWIMRDAWDCLLNPVLHLHVLAHCVWEKSRDNHRAMFRVIFLLTLYCDHSSGWFCLSGQQPCLVTLRRFITITSY